MDGTRCLTTCGLAGGEPLGERLVARGRAPRRADTKGGGAHWASCRCRPHVRASVGDRPFDTSLNARTSMRRGSLLTASGRGFRIWLGAAKDPVSAPWLNAPALFRSSPVGHKGSERTLWSNPDGPGWGPLGGPRRCPTADPRARAGTAARDEHGGGAVPDGDDVAAEPPPEACPVLERRLGSCLHVRDRGGDVLLALM